MAFHHERATEEHEGGGEGSHRGHEELGYIEARQTDVGSQRGRRGRAASGYRNRRGK
jgi:hypothetical protein